jgi:hypothetical protein
MIKNILNLNGTTLLTGEQQKSINGNGSSIRCTIGELEAIYNGNPRGCIIIPQPQPVPEPIFIT